MPWLRVAPVFVVSLLLLSETLAAKESWVEVRSPNFRVLTEGGDKQARRIASELEGIRSLYLSVMGIELESADRITVFAAKNAKAFEELLPPGSRESAGKRWAGVFLEVPYGYTILFRLDVQGEFRFRTVYHEYFHYLARKKLGVLPPWLNEGLAEYWDTIDVREKEVRVGRPDDHHIHLLRDATHLPLETLLTADRSSPHYSQERSLALFYAQSWALTHMLQSDDDRRKQLESYVTLLRGGADRLGAARESFGDLDALGEDLKRYVRKLAFRAVLIRMPPPPGDDPLVTRSLPEPEALAVQGSHFVRVGDLEQAELLLSAAVKADPQLSEAHESLGLLRYRRERDQARASFEEAIRLDPSRFLSHFVLGEMLASELSSKAAAEEHYLRVLGLYRGFAPAYRALAWYYLGADQSAKRSTALSRQAVSLEPYQPQYRLDWAYFLGELGETDPARREAGEAARLALAMDGPYSANNVCWFGSLYGFASTVMGACEGAVARVPEGASFRDSRGLARALTGDAAGAIEDFRYFVENAGGESAAGKETRQRWIEKLEKGENPFDEGTLRTLRGGR